MGPGPTQISPFLPKFWTNLWWRRQENFGLEVISENVVILYTVGSEIQRRFQKRIISYLENQANKSYSFPKWVMTSSTFFGLEDISANMVILYTVGSEILCRFQKRIISYHENQANKCYSFPKWVVVSSNSILHKPLF